MLQPGSQGAGAAALRASETPDHAATWTEKLTAVLSGGKGKDAAGRRQGALALTTLSRHSRARILAACALLLLGGVLGWRKFGKFSNASDKTHRPVQAVQLSRFTASGNVVAATLSPDGKYVATALEENSLQSLWLASGR